MRISKAMPVPHTKYFRNRLFFIVVFFTPNITETADSKYCKKNRHMKALLARFHAGLISHLRPSEELRALSFEPAIGTGYGFGPLWLFPKGFRRKPAPATKDLPYDWQCVALGDQILASEEATMSVAPETSSGFRLWKRETGGARFSDKSKIASLGFASTMMRIAGTRSL